MKTNQEMQDLDPMTLIVIFKNGGFIQASCLSRKFASDLIRNWYSLRCHVFDNVHPEETERAKHHLECGTYAANFGPEGKYAGFAFAWSEVVGMYTIDLRHETPQERIAKAVERQLTEGDEWKEEDE